MGVRTGIRRLNSNAEPRLVFSPDTVIRTRAGRLLVHTASSSLPAFETDQPMLVGWLCQFARPVSEAEALATLDTADHADARGLIRHLQRAGSLVAADAAPAGPDATQRSRQHLRQLARSVYETASDVMAFGPWIEQHLSAGGGLGLERRLGSLLAAVDGLRAELQAAREQHLRGQLAQLGVAAGARDLKLHVGCGPQLIEGWINIDVHPAPLSLNVLRGLPFADGSVRRVFVSHLLEHLFYPVDVQAFLAELRRVLQPGGRVRFVVPDVARCIEAYVERDAAFFASRREYWPWWPKDPTRLEDFLAYAGAGPEPAYLFEAHKYGYDFETLHKVLAAAGFAQVAQSAFMASDDPELRVDEASAVARARYGDRHYSLFVEAVAPG
jgi:predicted SAM-dependent methyltransferase